MVVTGTGQQKFPRRRHRGYAAMLSFLVLFLPVPPAAAEDSRDDHARVQVGDTQILLPFPDGFCEIKAADPDVGWMYTGFAKAVRGNAKLLWLGTACDDLAKYRKDPDDASGRFPAFQWVLYFSAGSPARRPAGEPRTAFLSRLLTITTRGLHKLRGVRPDVISDLENDSSWFEKGTETYPRNGLVGMDRNAVYRLTPPLDDSDASKSVYLAGTTTLNHYAIAAHLSARLDDGRYYHKLPNIARSAIKRTVALNSTGGPRP